MYCSIGAAIAVAVVLFLLKRIRTSWAKEKTITITGNADNVIPIILCCATAICLWIWGNKMAMPAYDEVFSAQNAAGIHPFQCVSYYMLPNNHLLFNLLNGLFFHSFADKVVTGRILSLIAYLALIISLYYWFKQLFKNRWLGLLASITLALQFPVWGFSFQARGYELYLLAEWGLLISLFSYLFSHQKKWLYLNTFCCVAGYFCMPSFLYFHAAQMLFMLLYRLFNKREAMLFWKFQLAAVLSAYLCYLPALCFSGLQAIVFNAYTAPLGGFVNKPIGVFTQWMFAVFQPYINYIFPELHWKDIPVNLVLSLLPLMLLAAKKKTINRLFGLFWLCLWVVFFMLVIIMKRLPYERNLIGHFSITLAGVILVAHWFTGLSTANKKIKSVVWGLFPAVLILFSVLFLKTNEPFLKTGLYGFDVNKIYTELDKGFNYIPPGSTVAFSDIDFYCYYLCRKKGCIVHKCASGNEDYFVKQNFEPLPVSADRYLLVTHIGDYEVYKRK